MKLYVTLVSGALLVPYAMAADQDLVGRYTGSIMSTVRNSGGNWSPLGVTVVINSVDNGKVLGTASHTGRHCGGEYPMEGTLQANDLQLRSTKKGGRAGDCDFLLSVKLEGTRLVGTTGEGGAIQLSK